MQGFIDTSFQTSQRDLFASGVAARIGMNAFGVWIAIKSHADYNTGQAWPGMRRLATLTGLSLASVFNCVHTLLDAKLLRVVEVAKGKSRRGSTYVARERLDVRLGERVLCTIVIDYVPSLLRSQLREIDSALKSGKGAPAALAECEILPGEGFAWDSSTNSLRASLPASDVPALDLSDDQLKAPVMQKLIAMQKRAKAGRGG